MLTKDPSLLLKEIEVLSKARWIELIATTNNGIIGTLTGDFDFLSDINTKINAIATTNLPATSNLLVETPKYGKSKLNTKSCVWTKITNARSTKCLFLTYGL